MPRLKGVTLKQFENWLKKNKHVTDDSGKQDTPGTGRGLLFDIEFDSKLMLITKIQLYGKTKRTSLTVSTFEQGSGTILDEVDFRLSEDFK